MAEYNLKVLMTVHTKDSQPLTTDRRGRPSFRDTTHMPEHTTEQVAPCSFSGSHPDVKMDSLGYPRCHRLSPDDFLLYPNVVVPYTIVKRQPLSELFQNAPKV